MIAELKEIMSSDYDLTTFSPTEADNFGIWVTATIGPAESSGGDLFQILICTPKWLSQKYLAEQPLSWGNSMLLTRSFDLKEISQFINKSLKNLEANSWAELAPMIGRLGEWEFSNYKEFK